MLGKFRLIDVKIYTIVLIFKKIVLFLMNLFVLLKQLHISII